MYCAIYCLYIPTIELCYTGCYYMVVCVYVIHIHITTSLNYRYYIMLYYMYIVSNLAPPDIHTYYNSLTID